MTSEDSEEIDSRRLSELLPDRKAWSGVMMSVYVGNNTVDDVADDLGISSRTIRGRMDSLADSGYFNKYRTVASGGKLKVYELTDDGKWLADKLFGNVLEFEGLDEDIGKLVYEGGDE